jgi:hypothetical protein
VIHRVRMAIAMRRTMENRGRYGATGYHFNAVINSRHIFPLIDWFRTHSVWNLTNEMETWPDGVMTELDQLMPNTFNNMFGNMAGWGFELLDSLREFHNSPQRRRRRGR